MIGFGSTEKEYASLIKGQILDFISANVPSDGFDDQFIESVECYAKEMAEDSRKQADSYKTDINHPERYSSFYSTVLGNNGTLFVRLEFSHINRKHPMSPDGWAMMQDHETFSVSRWDYRGAK